MIQTDPEDIERIRERLSGRRRSNLRVFDALSAPGIECWYLYGNAHWP
jgi:hypothetical protein